MGGGDGALICLYCVQQKIYFLAFNAVTQEWASKCQHSVVLDLKGNQSCIEI